jgi:flagellar hook-associated protein 1 FlgK
MRSTFMGIEMGRRSILTQQATLDVTGHNIANANTPGYTRQVAAIQTTAPFAALSMNNVQPGQFGTGVMVGEIRRLRDEFIDMQIRDESQASGYWESLQTALDTVEVILNEPSDQGLRGVLDDLWESWQALVESPENESVREVVKQRGMAVADTFHHMYNQLSNLRLDLNSQVRTKVEEINSIAQQIADVNQQIKAITLSGQAPNDLIDRRDLLLDQISRLVDAQITVESNGMASILVGGAPLVMGVRTVSLGLNTDNKGMYKVVWDLDPDSHPGSVVTGRPASSDDIEVSITSGELLGLLEARGFAENSKLGQDRNLVPRLMDTLNQLAKAIVIDTNAIHRQGYSLNNINGENPDGIDFFNQDGIDVNDPNVEWAKQIRVDDRIIADVKNIAAASSRTRDDSGTAINFGDGGNALKLAQLKQSLSGTLGPVTFDDYWRSQVSSIGVLAQEATRMVENQDTLLNQLELRRQATAGVSLDEEMTNMIKFQHAYNAAARYIAAIDEAIDVIINRMGITGR